MWSIRTTFNYCRSGNFRVFKFSGISDFRTFRKFRIREFTSFFCSVIIIIIIERFLNSRICHSRKNQNIANITRYTVLINTLFTAFKQFKYILIGHFGGTDTAVCLWHCSISEGLWRSHLQKQDHTGRNMKTNSTGHSPVDPERNTTIPGEYLYTEIVSPSVIKVKVTGLKYNSYQGTISLYRTLQTWSIWMNKWMNEWMNEGMNE